MIKGGGRTLMEKESESKAREEVKRALREEAEHVAKKEALRISMESREFAKKSENKMRPGN